MKTKYETPKILSLLEKDTFIHAMTQYQFIFEQQSCSGATCNEEFQPPVMNGNGQLNFIQCLENEPKDDPNKTTISVSCKDGTSHEFATLTHVQNNTIPGCEVGHGWTITMSISPELSSDCIVTEFVFHGGDGEGNKDFCDIPC